MSLPLGLLLLQVLQPETPVVIKVDVVARTAKAINYRHRSGATKIDFKGTALLPESKGEAKVESKQGYIEIEVEFRNLQPATKFGPEYLTYVLWAITPEGRPQNLGEILLNGTNSKLNVTSEYQQFGLIVTAEPYFAVAMPSNLVIMENEVRKDTLGKVDEIDAKYELLERGEYTRNTDKSKLASIKPDGIAPLEVFEARNALLIAEAAGAPQYAQDIYLKSKAALTRSEGYLARIKYVGAKPIAMMARESVQTAEDARMVAVRRKAEVALMEERAAAVAREQAAKDATEKESRLRADAEAARRMEEARRIQAEADRLAAEQKSLQSQLAAERAARQEAEAKRLQAEAERLKAEADRAKAEEQIKREAAERESQKLREAAMEAQRLREAAEREKTELRERLLKQFSQVLDTRDSERGLVVNMSDVLFDSGKFSLRAEAREKLAKLSGILLSHPGLKLEVEGHTDAIGGDEYNQKLSEKRAESVRGYLVEQGMAEDTVTSVGFGKTNPIAPNTTSAGRQQNRRVELVVSGEVIGTRLSDIRKPQ